ncbi:MAG: hypothetical protein HQL51_07080 [Magnetococcales bacterium]|nr:hypothetical protein [Magnetococcales bacterium]
MIVADDLSGEEKRLWLERLDRLTAEDRRALGRFADFLASGLGRASEPPPPPISQVPLPIPRPKLESSVGALKRLKRTYPMIDADASLLDDASRLLMRRMLGTPDPEVIDQMEALFAQRYQRWHQERETAVGVPEG